MLSVGQSDQSLPGRADFSEDMLDRKNGIPKYRNTKSAVTTFVSTGGFVFGDLDDLVRADKVQGREIPNAQIETPLSIIHISSTKKDHLSGELATSR